MRRQSKRGFAMLGAIMVMMLLAIIAIAVLTSVSSSRRRAIRTTRGEVRESCAYAGLNYARSYFASNYASWGSYLSNVAVYNPMKLPGSGSPGYQLATDIAAVKGANANLVVDLDGDGGDDVVIFMRDNIDEFPPAIDNYFLDNDQNVIVGAVCISSTMTPRRDDGTIDTDRLVMESMMAYNPPADQLGVQATGGSAGTGNVN